MKLTTRQKNALSSIKRRMGTPRPMDFETQNARGHELYESHRLAMTKKGK